MIRYLHLSAILSACLAAESAFAQPMCIGTADALAQLYEQKFKAANEGQLAPDAKVTVYTRESGEFLVIVEQNGKSCIVATGRDWKLAGDAA